MNRISLVWLLSAAWLPVVSAEPVSMPRPLLDGVAVELIATEPEIVTPVGVVFDKLGRLLVVESHTHKRQQDYAGPKGDRIRLLSDTNGDGRISAVQGDAWSTFAEGYTFAMNMALHPATGDVYLVCRNELHRLRDADGDGVAEVDEVLLRVETNVNYPHNGLGGIAFGGDNQLYLGFGENFGAAYTIIGADGSKLAGRGGVGIVFQCNARGEKLSKVALGFWNPFGLCYVSSAQSPGVGNLFCIDNDPDASPPCRLIHVLPAGDYGHRWEYGRAGLHPLQAWDGELPGTLGMMAGTGEAPCTVLEHNGWLWVTSWGEHRIERYRVSNEGKRLAASREIVVQGNADFRPTGMAVGPDGAMYFSDWVSRSYPVHGAGRVWRMTIPTEVAAMPSALSSGSDAKRQHRIAATAAQQPSASLLPTEVARNRLETLQALRFAGASAERAQLESALQDTDALVRLYAVRWIADEHLTEFKPEVERLLDGEIPSERYYLAVLAAMDWLDGQRKPRKKSIADELLLAEISNPHRSSATRALALRLVNPNLRRISIESLQDLYRTGTGPLRSEAIRTLAVQNNPRRVHLLAKIAQDTSASDADRADAVAGLAAFANEKRELLTALANNGPSATKAEAKRASRLALVRETPEEARPSTDDIDAWLDLLGQAPGNADSGRRLFHNKIGVRCSACHQHAGRGGVIGPALTHVGAKLSRRRLVESILKPSRELAPRYEPWVLETVEGRVLTGLRLPQGGDNGKERYADSSGNVFQLNSEDIDARTVSKASIMPSGLEKLMTVQDFRDLLAFLQQKE